MLLFYSLLVIITRSVVRHFLFLTEFVIGLMSVTGLFVVASSELGLFQCTFKDYEFRCLLNRRTD